MEKKYQVFVSSTYADLLSERQEVMHALLELDCIPSGMELFPAANSTQWEFIKKVIADCDYYLVILAGRYGSIGEGGLSYTEMEFNYALALGKPCIAFLHKSPEKISQKYSENSDQGRSSLAKFREVLSKRLCKHWESPTELGSVVSRSLIQLMKTAPAVGWIRAENLVDQKELEGLRKRVGELEQELKDYATNIPRGTEHLAQQNDLVNLTFQCSLIERKSLGQTLRSWSEQVQWSWDFVAGLCLSAFQHEGTEAYAERLLESHMREKLEGRLQTEFNSPEKKTWVSVSFDQISSIIIQFRALGYIVPSIKKRYVCTRTVIT